MENSPPEQPTPWYIGQHESRRDAPVTDVLLQQAQAAGYDMVTSPITTAHFQTSVLNLISTYYQTVDASTNPEALPIPLVPALKPIDSPLTPNDPISQLIITTATWIDLASSDPVIANLSQQVFNLEVAYAAFCGVQHVVVQGPKIGAGSQVTQFARALQEAISIGPYIQFHVLMPAGLVKQKCAEDQTSLAYHARPQNKAAAETVSEWSSWETWNTIRRFCNFSDRVSLALSITKQLPPAYVLSRWASEPLRLIFIPESSFVINNTKYQQPVLPKSHKALIYRFMRLRSAPWILLCDVGAIPSPDAPASYGTASSSNSGSEIWPLPSETSKSSSPHPVVANDPTPHLSYFRWLQKEQQPKAPIERFGAGYQDYLQAPLQPLADNLESITYEVFEKDPIKYEWYERAIAYALMDWATEAKPTSGNNGAVVIAVVGSGRGPLVTRALRASQTTGVEVEVWAIEKNPNAYVLLQRHNELEWNGRVTVVKTDMRSWKGPQLADGTFGTVDILVSELLGSFADNELSPECLDGVQHVLAPEYGISIPASYTAHITPIYTPRLYSELFHKSVADKDVFDLPYVVMLHQHDYLSIVSSDQKPTLSALASLSSTTISSTIESNTIPNVQTCWEFKHPISPTILAQANLRRGGSAAGGYGGTHGGDGANEHNSRSCHLSFPCEHRGTCHGLAGYFETVLYTSSDIDSLSATSEDPDAGSPVTVELSTNPVTMDRKSRDMISWFPIYFPLRTPINFPDGAELDVSMWRMTDDRKVWYEWCVEAFIRLPSGERVKIGGGEVHSSRKNGCLM
ncbi:uncharacterized protein PV09_02953 [Verruconis gallopava]|uniref:Protein arginine N-methyltransferase n=1 Tax=Verruconis gallopava TaxID=253628 RepID=A0A0D2B5P4_9PEZI|nr:uncharacterized protein PV09_02953 [Verruconis gallopava]KIW06519.1 hypothetical protein PV09_02953 [Verruconis gallopava]